MPEADTSDGRLDREEEYLEQIKRAMTDRNHTLLRETYESMTEAVKNYHQAYGGDEYDESTAEYAKQNYSRAYKRIQIIISFLHGEEPTDPDLTIEYQTE